ncbi:hypothetical protein DFR71_1453 [Nocardia alba]|uniref:Uncharacterized protein n=1 Tax=Nocardia alba TaxID=225051 RepID=A0A4R1G2B9_9NOCA|nr:hypothetical protein DFR71_1453 [Nocardia alba]
MGPPGIRAGRGASEQWSGRGTAGWYFRRSAAFGPSRQCAWRTTAFGSGCATRGRSGRRARFATCRRATGRTWTRFAATRRTPGRTRTRSSATRRTPGGTRTEPSAGGRTPGRTRAGFAASRRGPGGTRARPSASERTARGIWSRLAADRRTTCRRWKRRCVHCSPADRAGQREWWSAARRSGWHRTRWTRWRIAFGRSARERDPGFEWPPRRARDGTGFS